MGFVIGFTAVIVVYRVSVVVSRRCGSLAAVPFGSNTEISSYMLINLQG